MYLMQTIEHAAGSSPICSLFEFSVLLAERKNLKFARAVSRLGKFLKRLNTFVHFLIDGALDGPL